MKKALFMALAIALQAAALAGTAHAQATGTLDVAANVVGSCTVSSTPVDFGDVPGNVATPGTGSITVNCSAGLPYNIALDAGLNYEPAWEARQVNDGSGDPLREEIGYSLCQSGAPCTSLTGDWGDAGFAGTHNQPPKAGTGTGADEVHTVFGQLWAVSPGGYNFAAYSDTVNVSVHF